MQWFTKFDIPKQESPFKIEDKFFSIGSCFAESMGQRMKDSKFDILINPFGTIFHPLAISQLLQASLEKTNVPEDLYLERDDMHFHYWAHSKIMGKSKVEVRGKLLGELALCREYLIKSNVLILTLGTAWVYELKSTSDLVANCHKKQGNIFQKRLTPLEEMKKSLVNTIQLLKKENPQIHVVLTVSPVRHIKDGISENQLSKSLLRVLCDELSREFENVGYFPAYEIMIDELRDYRFYKPDMIHPTQQAEEYIWEKWIQTHFSQETIQLLNEIKQLKLDLAHRPLSPASNSHQKFLNSLKQKLERMSPRIDFTKELEEVNSQLSEFKNPS